MGRGVPCSVTSVPNTGGPRPPEVRKDLDATGHTVGDRCTPININLLNFILVHFKSRSSYTWYKIHEIPMYTDHR